MAHFHEPWNGIERRKRWDGVERRRRRVPACMVAAARALIKALQRWVKDAEG